MEKHIKWYTLPTLYVDIDTGEKIENKHLKGYIAIKTDKTTTLNGNGNIGQLQYIIRCKRNPQGSLFPDNNK